MLTRRDFIGGLLGVAGTASLVGGGIATAPRWQLGCYTRPWAEFDYRVALDGIAAAGFKYAGLMTSQSGLLMKMELSHEQAAAMGDEVRRRGLELSSAYGDAFPFQRSIAEGTAGLRRLIDNCAACGCPNLLLGGTKAPHQEAYYRIVAECCDYALERGVGLSIKPHGGTNATGTQCRRLIERIGHANFKLWYDPGNILHYSGGKLDPVDDAAAVGGVVVGMSVKDYRHPKTVNITPGTGEVDFRLVLARLRTGGFQSGPLVVECLEPGDLARTQAEAIKVRRFLERLTAESAVL